MDRNFALLGLNEGATKAQVQQAYERRLKKYQSSDYDDEKEYANRKIRELKAAYEIALSRAETGSSASAEADRYPARGDGRSQERKTYSSQLRERNGIEKNKERKSLEKPDLSALKNKAKEAKRSLQQYQKEEKAFETEVEKDSSSIPTIGGKSTNNPEKAKSAVSLVLSLIIALVGMFTMCDSDDNGYPEEDYNTGYSYAFQTEDEQQIFDTALDAGTNLTEQSLEFIDEEERETDNQEELQEQADLFARNYIGKDTIAQVVDDLFERYDEFFTNSSDIVEAQVEETLLFYGFESLDLAQDYCNPYDNEEPIQNLTDYLIFLNGYYDEYGMTW